MTNDVLLNVEHVTKVFGAGERQFTALKDINLTIREGEFVALLGPSGCGKSTLLRMITGLIPPSEGQVSYRGQLVQGINPKTTMVFQSFALYPWLSVLDNVALGLEARGDLSRQRFAKAEKLVDLDDAMATWRHKHVLTVERIIGGKRGTGGTAGVSYLQGTLAKRAFPELWSLRTAL